MFTFFLKFMLYAKNRQKKGKANQEYKKEHIRRIVNFFKVCETLFWNT